MKSIKAACQFFVVTEDELLDENRKKGVISKARHFIMWYHFNVLGESYVESARAICMNHGSALYGVKALTKKIEKDMKLHLELRNYIKLVATI